MPGDKLGFRLECSTSMYEQSTDILDQARFATIFIRLLYVSKYGLLRPSTIKHDFYSINWTFTGFTYDPTDFCSSSIPYDLYTILTRLSSLVEWTSCAVVYTVSHGLKRSLTVLYGLVRSHAGSYGLVRSLIRLYTDMAPVSVILKVLKIIHGFHRYTRMARV